MTKMLDLTQWSRTWGFDTKQWTGIFRFCRSNRIPMVGLNIPTDFVNLVAQRGLSGLPEGLKPYLPDMDLQNQSHYDRFQRVMNDMLESHTAHGRPLNDESFRRLYQAQTLFDEYMAESASEVLSSDPNTRILTISGSFHVEARNGIPERVTRRTSEPAYVVVSRSVAWDTLNMPKIDHPEGSATADLLWYIPREIDQV